MSNFTTAPITRPGKKLIIGPAAFTVRQPVARHTEAELVHFLSDLRDQQTPFLSMILPYLRVSPVITTTNAVFARS